METNKQNMILSEFVKELEDTYKGHIVKHNRGRGGIVSILG